MTTRIEKDSMGEIKVPADALYGAQTQRAINNFTISGQSMPESFIRALALIKLAAARSNGELGLLDHGIAEAIATAANKIADGDHYNNFPVDIFQTGSGTSTNMNMNEVLATLASQQCGQDVHPNDHVNMCQSSNDVIPTAIHLSSALELNNTLLPALQQLISTIKLKAQAVSNISKTGRTHLMDAMPLTLGQELSGWEAQLTSSLRRFESVQPQLCQLAQGGTAVGTGVNAHPDFSTHFADTLSKTTSLPLKPADNFFEVISAQDTALNLSAQLRGLAVILMKISNDLRWMNSGPLTGLAEIELEALQPGSSIMPGKVNPVIPEAVAMAAAQVIGNDTTVTVAAQSGNFQLNVMLPVIATNLLQSITLLANSCSALADKVIASFQVNEENLRQALALNPILATALNPVIGYNKAAEIAKAAYQQNRPVIDVAEEMTNLSRPELEQLLSPERLTQAGIR